MRPFGSERERWTVGGLMLHTVASDLTVVPALVGSQMRGDNVQVARSPGARWRRKWPDQQVLSFVLEVSDEDEFGRSGALFDNLDRVKSALRGKVGEVEVEQRTVTTDGVVLVKSGHGELVAPFDVVVNPTVTFARVGFQVQMADPFLYGRRRQATGKSGTFALLNPGGHTHHNALVRIYGPATDPTFSCDPSETSFTWSGSLSESEWIEIDSRAYTVVDQDGESVAGALSRTQPAFVELAPGRNICTLSAGTCDVSWEPAWL